MVPTVATAIATDRLYRPSNSYSNSNPDSSDPPHHRPPRTPQRKTISSVEEGITQLEIGAQQRHMAETKMNVDSSRSHSMCTFYLVNNSKCLGRRGGEGRGGVVDEVSSLARTCLASLSAVNRMTHCAHQHQRQTVFTVIHR